MAEGASDDGRHGNAVSAMVYDIAVVGGGIVGLATSRELLLRHPRLKLANVEKEPATTATRPATTAASSTPGSTTSPARSRPSCASRAAIWRAPIATQKNIPYKMVGKLIVATEESELGPAATTSTSAANRTASTNLELLDARANRGARTVLPRHRGRSSRRSPASSTGASSPQHYADDVREAGADMYLGHEVRLDRARDGVTKLATTQGRDPSEVRHHVRRPLCRQARADDRRRARSEDRAVPRRLPDPQARESAPRAGQHLSRARSGSFRFSACTSRRAWTARSGSGRTRCSPSRAKATHFWDINPPELWDALTYPGFFKLAMKYWQVGAGEMYRDLVRSAYVQALQRYIPSLTPDDCLPGPSGVRAQAMSADGSMVDDFVFEGQRRASCTCATRPRPPRRRRWRSASTSPTMRNARFDLAQPSRWRPDVSAPFVERRLARRAPRRSARADRRHAQHAAWRGGRDAQRRASNTPPGISRAPSTSTTPKICTTSQRRTRRASPRPSASPR